ncbi:MAG: phosphonate C-P lyase system protein PhnH [Betaproteobacteria bacterium]|nr:phosphonate C-P lyase system protein PhnH [Betaproteobacteria bacterium]
MRALPTLPGFSNPVDDAQVVFRAVLDALSRPGISVLLSTLPPPLPVTDFSQGMLALALTLCDGDTPLWLDEAADTPEVRHHLRFHCGSPFASSTSEVSFAFIARPEGMPRLAAFNQGRADFPDRSATLIISTNLSERHGQVHELSGPGVKGSDRGNWQSFCTSGLPAWFREDWEANHASCPLGVDIIFVDTGVDNVGIPQVRLLGLPRTARIREAAYSPASKEQSVCM